MLRVPGVFHLYDFDVILVAIKSVIKGEYIYCISKRFDEILFVITT